MTLRGHGREEGVQGFLEELSLGLDSGSGRVLQVFQDRFSYMSGCEADKDQGRGWRATGVQLSEEDTCS